MSNPIIRIARALTADVVRDEVHFHSDSAGRAFVCDNARCDSPGLDVDRD